MQKTRVAPRNIQFQDGIGMKEISGKDPDPGFSFSDAAKEQSRDPSLGNVIDFSDINL